MSDVILQGDVRSCLKQMRVERIDFKTCVVFCQKWHYSKSCPPGKAYFGLFSGNELEGVACYGTPAMRNQAKCYGADIELRRLCCIDDTPPNTESYFIGKTLKLIRLMGFVRCLSLADPNFGHRGIIYRASNFEYMGRERGGGSRDVYIDGVKMHSRTAFAKYGASGYAKLRKLFPAKSIEVKDKERKYVYVYTFDPLSKTERIRLAERRIADMVGPLFAINHE